MSEHFGSAPPLAAGPRLLPRLTSAFAATQAAYGPPIQQPLT